MIPQIHQEGSLAKLKTSEIAEFMELICLITVASKSSITATASLEFLAGRSHDSMIFRKGTGDFKDKQGHGQNTFFSKMKGIQLPMKHGRRLLMQGQGLAQIHITWMFLDIRIVSPPAWNDEKFDIDGVSANLHSHLIGSFTGQVYSRRFSLKSKQNKAQR